MRRANPLIVGGGPAGCAAAIVLARGGARPLLLERSEGERDVVCGGFLGWDALARLARLGLDPPALGARPIRQVRLVAGSREITAALPGAAAGLSRRRLDAALLALAGEAGAEVRRGIAVRALEDGRIRLDDGSELATDALFLATGKHELRGAARAPGRREPVAGLRTRLALRPDLEGGLAGTIELHLLDRAHAGLLIDEDGVNLCISVARARLAAAGSPAALLAELAAEAPALAARIGDVEPDHWEAIAGVPYGWRARAGEPGLFRIGDQAAVIASLAGDGIALALASGDAAAQAMIAGGPDAAPGYQEAFARRAARPLALAETLRRGAERGVTRTAMMAALGLAPGLVPLAARLTRIG